MTVYSSIITDGSGTVVRNISYQPWGNVHSNTEESGASTLDPSRKFTGQILDDSTELYYYGARYYDPTIRRFITPDTIVQSPYDPQSLNRYAYVRNNPLIYTDPSGNWRLDNFLVSTLQVASYASMFAGGWGMPIAIASSMAQTGLQGGHLDNAIQAGAIGGVSSLIGQGVALGIGPAGLGEGFGRTVVAGAGAGFASGGIGSLMSGQSGAAVWQSAFKGAAMGAATAGVIWGITQGNSEIALYRKAVSGLREAKAAAKNLNIANYPMYAAMLEYSAGAHINQAGISFTINDKETTIQGEIVLLDLGDFGAQAGVTDLSGTGGENAGIQISMGIFGKYCGPYITLKKNFDYTYSVFNPLRYIDGFGIGMGVGLSSPGTVTINPD